MVELLTIEEAENKYFDNWFNFTTFQREEMDGPIRLFIDRAVVSDVTSSRNYLVEKSYYWTIFVKIPYSFTWKNLFNKKLFQNTQITVSINSNEANKEYILSLNKGDVVCLSGLFCLCNGEISEYRTEKKLDLSDGVIQKIEDFDIECHRKQD